MRTVTLWTLCVVLGAAILARASRAELCIGLIGTEERTALQELWRPLVEDMAHSLGMPMRTIAYEDYAGAVWGLKTGTVQLAWLGNKAAADAVAQAACEVAFIAVEAAGNDIYYSEVIVRAESAIDSAKDLLTNAPALTFRMGDPNSTSGSVIPSYYLFDSGNIDPGTLFKHFERGSHEANFLAVVQGKVDAATINSFDLQRMVSKYPEHAQSIKVIWFSPPLPSDPLVWRKDLPKDLKQEIKTFLLDYGKDAPQKREERLLHERAVLFGLGRSGFRLSDNRQLLPIMQIELHLQKRNILQNESLSAHERNEKLRRLEKKEREYHLQGDGIAQ